MRRCGVNTNASAHKNASTAQYFCAKLNKTKDKGSWQEPNE
jgi:hypothetical protein